MSEQIPANDWVSMAAVDGSKLPDPVIWRENDGRKDTLLSAGEVAIFSGAGGVGKSYFALELAMAATAPQYDGEVFGLRVRTREKDEVLAEHLDTDRGERMRTIYYSYEDSPVRLRNRWDAILKKYHRQQAEPGVSPGGLYMRTNPEPLWIRDPAEESPGGAPNMAEWGKLWETVEKEKIGLLIIDPVGAAFMDHDANQTGPVRAFLKALGQKARDTDCGVLLVAHASKEARRAIKEGDIDPGIISGSAAWWDAARCVMVLWGAKLKAGRRRVFEVAKSNYARTDWGILLGESKVVLQDTDTWAGLYEKGILDENGLKQVRDELRAKKRDNDSDLEPGRTPFDG